MILKRSDLIRMDSNPIDDPIDACGFRVRQASPSAERLGSVQRVEHPSLFRPASFCPGAWAEPSFRTEASERRQEMQTRYNTRYMATFPFP